MVRDLWLPIVPLYAPVIPTQLQTPWGQDPDFGLSSISGTEHMSRTPIILGNTYWNTFICEWFIIVKLPFHQQKMSICSPNTPHIWSGDQNLFLSMGNTKATWFVCRLPSCTICIGIDSWNRQLTGSAQNQMANSEKRICFPWDEQALLFWAWVNKTV